MLEIVHDIVMRQLMSNVAYWHYILDSIQTLLQYSEETKQLDCKVLILTSPVNVMLMGHRFPPLNKKTI